MKKLLIACLLFLSSTSFASDVQILLGLNGSFGGETIIKLETSDGTDELRAGNGFGLHAGIAWRFMPEADLRATISTLSTSYKYENGSMSFNRYPVDISSHYFLGSHGLGGGLAYHLSPKVELEARSSNLTITGDVDVDNGLGYFVEYLYSKQKPGAKLGFYAGLRYTLITYHIPKINKDYSGNSFGIHAGLSF